MSCSFLIPSCCSRLICCSRLKRLRLLPSTVAPPLHRPTTGAEGRDEQRRRLRTELVRWHPDKFQGRFGRRLAPGEAEAVLARVNALSQALNAINASL